MGPCNVIVVERADTEQVQTRGKCCATCAILVLFGDSLGKILSKGSQTGGAVLEVGASRRQPASKGCEYGVKVVGRFP